MVFDHGEELAARYWTAPIRRNTPLAMPSIKTLVPRPFPATCLREAIEGAVVDALRRSCDDVERTTR